MADSPATAERAVTAAPASAISQYPDVPAVLADLDALISQPIRRLRPDALARYLDEHFEQRCQASKAMTAEAAEYIPGGVQHNLAFNLPFPLVITRAQGAHLVDLDGNEYLDFLQAGGPTVLGSNPTEVLEQVIALLRDCGPSTGLFHEYELKLARFIAGHMPAVPMFRMLGSGTEGCMAAIRVARLATGHSNVVKMGGAYHGWSDQLAYGLRIPGTRHHEAHGVPKHVFRHTQESFPGDLAALERTLRRNRARGGTAAVMIEPVGPESGTRPVPFDFNAGVRELCDRYGALLVFDEVVTGFRLGMGGAQGYFGVEPDLTVFGKVVAGGYPSAGGLGGKREFMKFLSAGIEAGSKKALVGGTMAANPLSSAAGYFTLVEMERTAAPQRAGAMGDRLTAGLRESIARRGLPFVAYNQGSIVHLQTVGTMHFTVDFNRPWEIPGRLKEIKARKTVMEQMGAAYMAEGVVTLAGSRLYTSAAHTEATIDQAIAAFDRVFANIEGALP
ncbi:MAG: aminotransferase class III-fold pyridoxal phosphate-dependent enzyme [Candidatus Nanopelagicales bacterium]|jgi:glutamate-1-semialdehyde 2,1-aminomutase|nr:aminotransferase class III-fold pyridoxal phosphate-dependent enzyme [Candidatus Nanopelagicales bacterium]